MSTEINSISGMTEQGGDIAGSAVEFKKTIDDIYDLYGTLKDSWTGMKADEYKKKIEELKEPLMTITGTIGGQGEAVEAAGKILDKFERL